VSLLNTSDLHAHNWARFSRTLEDGTNSRFADLLGILDQLEWAIDTYQPAALILGGDLTHQRFYVKFSIYNRLMKRILDLSKKVRQTILTVGNHDWEAEGAHSLTPFALAGLTVVDRPTWIDVESIGWCYFVPYMHSGVAEAMREPSRMPGRGFPKAAFLHYALDGHVLDSEYRLPSPLTLLDTQEFQQLWLAHVHSPVIEQDGRVIYNGAPMHFDFGDVGDRFCWLWDGEKAEPITLDAPQFNTVAYPRIPMPERQGDFLRILSVPPALFSEVKRNALDIGWADAMCVEAAVPTEAIRTVVSGAMVTDDLIRDFVRKHYPSLDDAAREPIVEAGLTYWRRAENRG